MKLTNVTIKLGASVLLFDAKFEISCVSMIKYELLR